MLQKNKIKIILQQMTWVDKFLILINLKVLLIKLLIVNAKIKQVKKLTFVIKKYILKM